MFSLRRVRTDWPAFLPVLIAAFLLWKPATQGPTTCPFALGTGHACPLCGGTRAAAALMKGDIVQAWLMHPIIFVVLPLLAAGWVRWVGVRTGRLAPLRPSTINRMGVVLGVLTLALWVVRGLSGTLPPI